MRWSAGDTCLSQLQALTRAGLMSAVLETHSDVDELPDLRALWARLAGEPDSTKAVASARTRGRCSPRSRHPRRRCYAGEMF